MPTSGLTSLEINRALNSLKQYREELSETSLIMENIINSNKEWRDVIEGQIIIEQRHNAIIESINKNYPKKVDAAKNEAELAAEKLRYEKENYDYQKLHSGVLDEINKKYEKERKEIEWRNKLEGEGVTLSEKLNHNLEGRVRGYAQIKKGLNEAKEGLTTIFNVGKDFMSVWGKVDQAAADYTKSIGGSAASMKKLTSETIKFVKQQQIGAKYNTSMEELIKLQEGYNKTIGRSIQLTNSQKESMAAMRQIGGDEIALKFSTGLENFGLDPEESSKIMGKMYNDAAKSGIAVSKYSDNFINNLKLAQNYTFKNGLDGLRSMAKKAAEIKLDMGQAESFANKVSTLEGAVKAGANLSVLGGSFAQFGNPLTMMYEGLNDMEALQDRMVNMFGNLGRWNSKTNMVDVSVDNKLKIKAAAEATGMDYTSIMNMIQAKGRANQVANQLKGYGFSEEENEFIKNSAQLDKNGKAFLSVAGKKTYLNDISKQQLQTLIETSSPDTDNIKTIAQTIKGWNDSIEGLKKQRDAIKAGIADVFGSTIKNTIEWISRNTTILTAAVALGAGGKILGGLGKTINGTRNIFGGLGRGFNRSNPSNNGGGFSHTLRSLKTSPVGTTDSFKLFGKKYTITNTASRGLQARANGVPIKAAKFAALKSVSGGLLGGAVGGLVQGIQEFGTQNNHSMGRKVAATATSTIVTGLGTAIGSFFGGPFGAMIGGYLTSRVTNILWNDERRNRFKSQFNLDNIKGDYSVRQLRRFDEYKRTGNIGVLTKRDKIKLRKNDDFSTLKSLVGQETISEGRANGGWVVGRGGSREDSIITPISNGEFVVNAKSAAANASLLTTINNSDETIRPRGEILKPLTVEEPQGTKTDNTKIDFGKGLTINLGGSIKLELGNKSITALKPEDLLNQNMINQIIKEIQRQINRGLNKEKQGIFKFA